MTSAAGRTLRVVLGESQGELLSEWIAAQLAASTLRSDLMKEKELREQSRELLKLLEGAVQSGDLESIEGADHGFKGADAERADKRMMGFFDRYLK